MCQCCSKIGGQKQKFDVDGVVEVERAEGGGRDCGSCLMSRFDLSYDLFGRTQCDTTCHSTSVSCAWRMLREPCGQWTRWNFTKDGRSGARPELGLLP